MCCYIPLGAIIDCMCKLDTVKPNNNSPNVTNVHPGGDEWINKWINQNQSVSCWRSRKTNRHDVLFLRLALNLDQFFGQHIVFARRVQLVGGARQHLSKGSLELHHFLFHCRDFFRENFFSEKDVFGLRFSIEGPQFGQKQSSFVL